MLELKSIYYHPATSEKPILQNISLTVYKGVPAVITGLSGSGKTSLLEIVGGLSRPQKGEISLDGKKINPRQRRSLSGVVFQFPERHFIGLTILQEMRLGNRKLSYEIIQEILTKVGLSKINLRQSPEYLSGGQQRRLSIAVQLTRKPKLLLLDEPTAGLDWSVKDEILQLIQRISNEMILIIVTHEAKMFESFQTSSFQLSQGRLNQLSLHKNF